MISGIYQVNVKYQSNHSFMLYQRLQTEYIIFDAMKCIFYNYDIIRQITPFDTFTEGNENNFQNE